MSDYMIIMYFTIPYYTTLHYTILYYTILYYTILYLRSAASRDLGLENGAMKISRDVLPLGLTKERRKPGPWGTPSLLSKIRVRLDPTLGHS